ncbi:Atlastin-1 isoform 4 [Schistosoma japonicum]|uniref:Atlastin-1 isoform 4 n=2 Tax=Schistosoma japonicum TaxID=6182 RepID=A0A4Z2DC72_SCHJA|nr:Atlastin-1 [Schistosoma japonicum]TNN14064.1 Atlastin-1 isoform 4 [Schistosoma japonicum]
MDGHAIQIINVEECMKKTSFSLNEESLSSILLRPDVRDKKVVVVSVAGAFRQGKSFLLDFFLRYLLSSDRTNWLGDPEKPLKGFPWRGGSERDTIGILLWSEPFFMILPSGEEVVVLLMDTQGSFDSTSTVRQCATVFALSTMVSSTQVYNIHGNIQEDHLQHLHLFTEYGRLALESDISGTPFQHLLFLVRDWSFPYEYDFGNNGGNQLLDNRLKIVQQHHTEHQAVRSHIRSCFSKLDCFLMPHPGLKVSTNPNFDGRVKDIDPNFIENLIALVPHLLAPVNLVVKKINGQEVTCRELFTYFKAYIKIYESDTLPEPRSMLEATAEANNLNAILTCQEMYSEAMSKICGPDRPYINPTDLDAAHLKTYKAAVEKFNTIPKMGGEAFSADYLERLKETLKQLGEDYRMSNSKKDIFKTFRTPAVLAVVLLIFHIITGLSEFVGLSMVSGILALPFYIALISLFTWLFLSYTGRAPELASAIDQSAEIVINKVFNPAIQIVGNRGMTHLVNGNIVSDRATRS